MVLMPDEKTWEKEGVRITYLCFDTMFSLKVQTIMRKKYLYPSPTPENPDQHIVPTPVFMFYMAMPLIMSVELEDGAKSWGKKLKQAVESPEWLSDPVADFIRFERRLPSNILMDCYDGYKETREKAFLAPDELRGGEPKPPTPDPETGGVNEDAQNFTNSNSPTGGAPLKIMPSQKQGAPSVSSRRKAK
jgi:hypothetical protein